MGAQRDGGHAGGRRRGRRGALLWLGQFCGPERASHGKLQLPGPKTLPGTSTSWVAAAIDDVDNDGRPDVLFGTLSDGAVQVFLNQGNAPFGTPISSSVGTSMRTVVLADFTHDGYKDLVVTGGNTGARLLVNQHDGTFGGPRQLLTGNAAQGLAAAEFNKDEFVDLAVSTQNGNQVVALIDGGCGTP